MANRFVTPIEQLLINSGATNSGGTLTFYLTGSSTPATTYFDSALTLGNENSNPLDLDSAGRPTEEIFLDPNVTYKVVCKDSDGVVLWTADPVVDPAANVSAAIQVYPGDPNGNVAGNQGTPGGSGASMVWDSVNNLLYICTTTGTAATAVWTSSTASIAGAFTRSGIITPTALSGSPAADAYAPSGFSGASVIRQDLSADVTIPDLPAGVAGDEKRWRNISTANFATFPRENSGSTAARRLSIPGPLVVGPGEEVDWAYDSLASRWYLVSHTGANGRTILTDAATVAWDVSTGVDFQVTLTAARTLGAFTKGTPGKEGRLFVRQDATGGWALDLSNVVYDFWGPSIQNIQRGASEETEYAYKVVSSGSMLLRRIGGTSLVPGGRDLLATTAASASATIDFVLTKWLQLYDRFAIEFDDVQAATDDTQFWMRTSTDGGATYDAGATHYAWRQARGGAGTADTGSSSDNQIILINSDGGSGMSSVAGETVCGHVIISSPRSAAPCKIYGQLTYVAEGASMELITFGGNRKASADVDAIRFMASSGNITSGNFRLYGVRK